MKIPDVNLHHLFLPIPVKYVNNHPVAYEPKSIGDILDGQDLCELIVLQDWISDQLMDYIDYDLQKPVTAESVAKAFEVFANLGIKPKGIVCAENYGEIDNDIDE